AGSNSANTPHSRIRLAINCEYWPPKSRTRTSSTACASTGTFSDGPVAWVFRSPSLTPLPVGGVGVGWALPRGGCGGERLAPLREMSLSPEQRAAQRAHPTPARAGRREQPPPPPGHAPRRRAARPPIATRTPPPRRYGSTPVRAHAH